jgi:hypothetical protein
VGRIERGGGDGGEPARSPPVRPRFRRLRDHACGCDICRRAEGKRGAARLLNFQFVLANTGSAPANSLDYAVFRLNTTRLPARVQTVQKMDTHINQPRQAGSAP